MAEKRLSEFHNGGSTTYYECDRGGSDDGAKEYFHLRNIKPNSYKPKEHTAFTKH